MTIVVHGCNDTHMVDWFIVGASIMKKYVDIVFDVLTSKEKLFNKLINIHCGQHFRNNITHFEEIPNLDLIFVEQYMNTHIFCGSFKQENYIINNDFFHRAIIIPYYNVMNYAMHIKCFEMFVLANLEEFMMMDNSKGPTYMHN